MTPAATVVAADGSPPARGIVRKPHDYSLPEDQLPRRDFPVVSPASYPQETCGQPPQLWITSANRRCHAVALNRGPEANRLVAGKRFGDAGRSAVAGKMPVELGSGPGRGLRWRWSGRPPAPRNPAYGKAPTVSG